MATMEATQGVTAAALSDSTNGNGVPNQPVDQGNAPPAGSEAEKAAAAAAEAKAKEAEAIRIQQEETDRKAKEAEDAKRLQEQQGEFEYNGNEYHDAAVTVLKDSGLTKVDAELLFKDAMESGDLGKIDQKALLAKLGGDKTKVATVMALVRGYHASEKARFDALLSDYHSLVGGKEAYDTVAAWSNKVTDPKVRKEIAELRPIIIEGGKNGKLALKELVALYKADPNTKGLTNGKLNNNGRAAGKEAGEPLSRNAYADAVKKVEYDRSLTPKAKEAALSALSARRAAGRRAGI